jgi:hypothetical protein
LPLGKKEDEVHSGQIRSVSFMASLLLLGLVAPSSAQRAGDEVWSESGLRVVTKSIQLEVAADGRARIRVIAAGQDEIVVESQTLFVSGGPSGVAIKSVGRAMVTAQRRRRTLEADSVEVWLSPDGWGYLKAVRRVQLQ